MNPELTIGELAERSGVATSALRFYEARGLIHSERTRAGHRRYPRAALRRVAFIVFAQRIGLGLEDVAAELARLPRNQVPAEADWAVLSAAWKQRVDARIAELERLRAGLTECIGCGCLSLKKCKLANPGDRAGRYGPGPPLWTGRLKRRSRHGLSRAARAYSLPQRAQQHRAFPRPPHNCVRNSRTRIPSPPASTIPQSLC